MNNFPQRFSADIRINFPPVIAPISAAGNNTIFFTPGNNQLFAWRSDGTPLIEAVHQITIKTWQGDSIIFQTALFDTVDGLFSNPPLMGDYNGDGLNEIIASVNSQRIIIWSFNIDPNRSLGERISELNLPNTHMLFWNQNLIVTNNDVIVAINSDQQVWELQTGSRVENICITQNNTKNSFLTAILQNKKLLLIDGNGQIAKQANLSYIHPDTGITSLISGFFESVAEPALIFTSKMQIFSLSHNLDLLDGFPLQLNEPIVLQPIISDIDHDGFGEIVCITSKRIYTYNHNGVICNGFPVDITAPFKTDDFLPGSPLALLNQNSGYIFLKDGSNDIMAIRHDGHILDDFKLNGGGETISPFLSLVDINQDGFIEIADPNSDGTFNVRQIDLADWQAAGSWLQTNYNPSGTRFNEKKPLYTPIITEKFLSYAFNYPNPTYGNQTTFRFFIQNNADVKIDIFDLSGEIIAKIKTYGIGNVENELVWSLENISSGVYMARLEVSDGKNKTFKMIKVAVVK